MKSPESNRAPGMAGFRMPAEWEPHTATWLAWPHHHDDWPGKFEKIPPVFVAMARELARVERVRLIVNDAASGEIARRVLTAGDVDLRQVDFFEAPTDRSWTRDFLPLFVKRETEVAAVKWKFDGWARYDNHQKDDAAGRTVAKWLNMRSIDALAERDGRPVNVVLEGGAIDIDGEGTLLASRDCLVDGPNARNRWLGTGGTERVLADYLGIERVVWVGAGVVGDDTAGHVDDFVRFVAPGKVVLAEESDTRDPNYAALEATREILEGARDARGRTLEILRLPMPRPVLWETERLPASYANYYVANDLVLVPVFDDASDSAALGIIAELFPARRVVGIDARDLVLGLGTVHCSTHEEPAAR
ncbi:MAG TPA: agmatine deiminase family protein [Polyangiaceae bacterium]|jgi:agmatine deiminase|nr:agmatine deiminase family protein [Polyangiaceae bacterium]